MSWTLLSLTAALLSAAPAAAPAKGEGAKPKLVVLDLAPAGGMSPELAATLTQALTTELAATGPFDVVSSGDVRTLLGLERQRQMAGCAEESESCLTELAGALGARFVMSGSLAQLGDAVQLTLQTLDTRTARPVGRATRIAPDLASLNGQLPWVLAEATATPPPQAPSRVLPITLVSAGGAAVVGAGVLGVQALGRSAQLRRELQLGETQAGALKSRAYYDAEARSVRTQKTLALVGAGAGAALAGWGTWLLVRGDGRAAPRAGGARALRLVPVQGGVGVAGVLP